MWSFPALCDEFSVAARLYMKLELQPSRETVLHFFERIRRTFPGMVRFRRREEAGVMLDEQPEPGQPRRYVRLDRDALRFGCSRPDDVRLISALGELVLLQAPHHLSLSDLDHECMEVTFGFDFEYRGNHDELLADVLFGNHPLLAALGADRTRVIDCQPYMGVALDDGCALQAYIDFKGRTTTYEVRADEYEANPLSVYLTIRRYWGFGEPQDLNAVFQELLGVAEETASRQLVPHILQPLRSAIAGSGGDEAE